MKFNAEDWWEEVKNLPQTWRGEADARMEIYHAIPELDKMWKNGDDEDRMILAAMVDARIDGHNPIDFLRNYNKYGNGYRKKYMYLEYVLKPLSYLR